MDIKKELDKNSVILLLVPSGNYNELVLQHAKRLSGNTVCFVTLNKTFPAIRDTFKKKKIDTANIVFIDAISKSMQNVPDQTAGCYYVSSPASLTELEIAAIKLLRHGFNYLMFDSLTSMLVYQKNAPLAKFVAALANNARQYNAKAVFYMIKNDEQKQTIDQVSAIVDRVIDLAK
ncbi:MAG: hypothetical protein NTV88_04775 [Candidatus Micrarchaeota archaeon]|nr:hypothetical protein [Candidatus Micrarchaeota archaeon]